MSTHTSASPETVVEEVGPEEGARLFDARSRALLGMSGRAFVVAYESGTPWAPEQLDAVTELALLLPFAR